MDIQCKPFLALSSLDIYEILRLRSEVFVVEQACIYQDIDGKDIDPEVHHLLVKKNESLLGYARLLPKGVSYENVSMGRLVVAPEMRGNGLGIQLIAQCIRHIQALWPDQSITIGAQSHLSALYQRFNFVEVSTHYLEDGIMHVDMTAITPQYKDFL